MLMIVYFPTAQQSAREIRLRSKEEEVFDEIVLSPMKNFLVYRFCCWLLCTMPAEQEKTHKKHLLSNAFNDSCFGQTSKNTTMMMTTTTTKMRERETETAKNEDESKKEV